MASFGHVVRPQSDSGVWGTPEGTPARSRAVSGRLRRAPSGTLKPMQPTTATLIVAAFGIVGTFGAPLVALKVNRSWQREQWVRDERLKEYRELLDALAESFRLEMLGHNNMLAQDELRSLAEATSQVTKVVRSRVFIAAEVHRLDIEQRWIEARTIYSETALDTGPAAAGPFAASFAEIQIDIARAVQYETGRKRRKAPRSGVWT